MRRLPPALAAAATPRILELLGDGPGRVLELGFAGIHALPSSSPAGRSCSRGKPGSGRAGTTARSAVVEQPLGRFDAVVAPEGTDLDGFDAVQIVLVDDRGAATLRS